MAEIIIYGTSAILGGCFMMYSYTSVRMNKEKKRTKIIKELQQKNIWKMKKKKRSLMQKRNNMMKILEYINNIKQKKTTI